MVYFTFRGELKLRVCVVNASRQKVTTINVQSRRSVPCSLYPFPCFPFVLCCFPSGFRFTTSLEKHPVARPCSCTPQVKCWATLVLQRTRVTCSRWRSCVAPTAPPATATPSASFPATDCTGGCRMRCWRCTSFGRRRRRCCGGIRARTRREQRTPGWTCD